MNRKLECQRLEGSPTGFESCLCSTWNILGMASHFRTVPRGTNPPGPFSEQSLSRTMSESGRPFQPPNSPDFPEVFHRSPFFAPPSPFPGPRPATAYPTTASPSFAACASGRFPQLCPVLHSATPYPVFLLAVTLDCHGKDSRRCQPKGRSWQNHHSNQPRRKPRSRRPQDPPRRLRSPGKLLFRARFRP